MKKLFVGIDIAKTKFDACIKNEMNEMMMKAREYKNLKHDMDRLISDILLSFQLKFDSAQSKIVLRLSILDRQLQNSNAQPPGPISK